MDTIFIDTNSLRNEKANSFFGNIEKYQRLAELVQIVIPSIVIEEIKRQKKRYLQSQLDKFKDNYFTKSFNLESGLSLKKHIDDKIKALYNEANNEISHIELELVPDGKLEKIKELAIKNTPPFEAETDKGFKDSYIYLTVLQYLETASDDVFIITNDSRLKQAFNNHQNIEVLSNPEDYYRYREEYFRADYFIGRMKEYFEDNTITSHNIFNVELKDDNDWEITIVVDGEEHQLLIDFYSKEIITD